MTDAEIVTRHAHRDAEPDAELLVCRDGEDALARKTGRLRRSSLVFLLAIALSASGGTGTSAHPTTQPGDRGDTELDAPADGGASHEEALPTPADLPTPAQVEPGVMTPLTTAPPVAVAPDSWQGVVSRLSLALVNPEIRRNERPLFLPGTRVLQFGEDGTQFSNAAGDATPRRLVGQFDGFVVLSARTVTPANMKAVERLATDVSRAVYDPSWPASPEVGQLLVQTLKPAPASWSTAELAATQWMTREMACSNETPLGLIVLWSPRASAESFSAFDMASDVDAVAAAAYGRVHFLLVRGEPDSRNRWRIADARFGTAMQALGGL
ncbi:MAG: hypothetical protein AAGK78_06560 [Planctomycetota bacterium]